MTDPYAGLALLYDAELDGASGDIAGYARRGVPGPLLVGGCGTGRVCRGLAPLRPVTGLDRSADMLARARALGGATYVVGDLERFDLGPFAEIILPHGTFAFLPDRRAQAACLRACAAALPPGAPLTVDLPMPDFALLGEAHTAEREAWEGVVGEERWRRTREVFRAPVAQKLRLVDRFYREGLLVRTSELALAIVHPREAEWMLEANGFYLEAAWGDHAGGPLREGCDRLVLYAIRA